MSNASLIPLVLATLAALFIQDQPSLKEQVKTAQDLVSKLEAENYAREPQLKQVEAEYERLQKFFEGENGRLANSALRVLDEEEKRTGKSPPDNYKAIRDAWLAAYGAQAANDPVKGPLIKAYAVDDPDHRKQFAQKAIGRPATEDELTDPDKLWQAFQAEKSKSEPRLRARVAQLEKDSGYPPIVLEFIRNRALSKVTLDGVYFPYIQVKTPKELHDARLNLVKLKQQLSNSPAQ